MVLMVISFLIVIVSLTFHEAAHAGAAYLLGDPTAQQRGRLSLNPLVHIDPIGTIILPLILAISNLGAFGWAKPVPVDLRYLKNPRKDHGLISAAGPSANFCLALAAALSVRVITTLFPEFPESSFAMFVLGILGGVMIINVVLMVFNILPLPPLDGAAILEMFLPVHLAYKFNQIGRYGFIILIVLLYSGILWKVFLQPLSGIFLFLLEFISGQPIFLLWRNLG